MITSLVLSWKYRRFQAACERPLEAQAAQLRRILRQAASTGIGHAQDFAKLARLADPIALIETYQNRIPIRSYREMRADLDAVYAGDWQRLCPSRPVFFAMTAGSTGQFKHIPITREFRKEVGRGSLIVTGALEAALPRLRGRKCQFLVGSAEGGVTAGGVAQGFMSGFNYKNLPRFVRNRFVLPYWVFTLADAGERAYAAGRILASERRLGALCAISPVNLINLMRALEANAARLCSDIEKGTLTLAEAGAGRWRGKSDPTLANALREARHAEGRFPARLLFPELEALVCWQGGTMGYHLHELERTFGPVPCYEFPVSASEGLFAVPGVLAVTTHFLEFFPEEDGHASPARALRADQLSVGACYRLVITTSGGLYRYDIEDVIRVTGMSGRTPVIAFVSKANQQVSVANERLSESDVSVAMRAASDACGLWARDFLFVPCSDKRYRVLVDGEALATLAVPGHEARLRHFATEIERQLRVAAKGYDFEREDALLEPLHLMVVGTGELVERAAKRESRQPLPNAQIKPCHLTNEFDAHAGFTARGTYAACGA